MARDVLQFVPSELSTFAPVIQAQRSLITLSQESKRNTYHSSMFRLLCEEGQVEDMRGNKGRIPTMKSMSSEGAIQWV